MAKNQKISVIIPAYSRHPLTVRHVQECLKSDRLPDEIIVVNDGGDPGLRDMLKNNALVHPSVKLIYARVEQDILWNYNGACNLGAWIATGDIIVIEDTDHIPDKSVYGIIDSMSNWDRAAFNRKCVDISELNGEMDAWKWNKGWGPNQMVAALKREVYIKLKGQDERFAGGYGWMCYDWKNRYNNVLKIKTVKANAYYYAILDGGEPKLKRNLASKNYKIYRENARREHPQHPHGILNFTYTIEQL